jgi:hypothetical protein
MTMIDKLRGGRASRRLFGGALTALFLGSAAACSVLLDDNSVQCRTDSDCAQFGGHPYCQSGACVSSGLGPSDCFYGTPQTPQQFMNQCSSAQCLPFDDCSRLDLCGDANVADGDLVSPPAPEAGASTTTASTSSSDAGPLPSCTDPANGRGQVVYLTGSSNFPPLLSKLAPLILATGYVPVFEVTSSCGGVTTAFDTDPGANTINDPAPGPSPKYAAYFNADGSSVPCTLGPNGASVDVGESDIFSTTCNSAYVAGSAVGEYLGPIQAMVFIVPGKSQQTAISAAAARAVFGMGGAGASPWTNPSMYFVRNGSTGTQQMIGHAVGVPANQFWGIDRGSAANVDSLIRVISDETLAQQAIGIISADYYDDDRANVKALAFRASDQECAYLPDSNEFKVDKQNVRDGHYPIWGPIHFFTPLTNGVPTTAGAQAFVSVVSVPNLAKSLVDAFIDSSLVPSCAMTVQRQSELGPLSPYDAPFQCGCYFQASPHVNGVAPPGCAACTTAADCTNPARPACNLGFCEVQ